MTFNIENAPGESETWYEAGLLANFEGNQERAETCFLRALELSNWDWMQCHRQETSLIVAEFRREQGREDEAQKLLSTVIDDLQKSGESGDQRAVVLFLTAAVKASQGRTAEACYWLRNAIDAGWWSLDAIQANTGLQRIQGEPCYKIIVAHLKAKTERVLQRLHAFEREYDLELPLHHSQGDRRGSNLISVSPSPLS